VIENRQIEYPAIVVNTSGDPDKQNRVQVRVLGMFEGFSDVDLPWATYKLPTGSGSDRGDFSPCKKDDAVWVDFPFYSHGEPDTRKPRITASMHLSVSGQPNIPKEATGRGQSHKKSSFKGSYHGSKVVGYNDCIMEMIPGGTMRCFSRKSGALIEVDANGKALVYGASDVEISADENININAGGRIDIKAGGNIKINGSRIDLNK